MKMTLLTTLAGPDGLAFPGWVIDVDSKAQCEDMVKRRQARPFDPKVDAKAKRGPLKPRSSTVEVEQ